MLQHNNRLTFSPLIIKDLLFYICVLYIYVLGWAGIYVKKSVFEHQLSILVTFWDN